MKSVNENFLSVMFAIFLLAGVSESCWEKKMEFNPCCGLPCQNQGVCFSKYSMEYECECPKGYYGKNCEQANAVRWMLNKLLPTTATKQNMLLTGKLLWGVVNNLPHLQQAALSLIYNCGSVGGSWRAANDYDKFNVFYNSSDGRRSVPPVPLECPTPLGIKGPKRLPEIDVLFDAVFRRNVFKPCPYGTNLMFSTFTQHMLSQFFKEDSQETVSMKVADASQIYGADQTTRLGLRSLVKGKLKAQILNDEEYPPYLEDVPGVVMMYPDENHTVFPKWAMGHHMLSSSPLLFTLATIWLREHNRVCDLLVVDYPDWDDERIYQTARWIILGELLVITGGEYAQQLTQYKLRLRFDPELVNGQTPPSNKMYHELRLLTQWHQTLPDVFSVQNTRYNMSDLVFSNNRVVFEHGLDAVVDSMTRSPTGQITFRNCGSGVRSAVYQLILEGRKYRLHSLNTYRRFYGLRPYNSFMQLVGDEAMAERLKDLYGDIDAVELLVGVFVERTAGSVVPPTLLSVIGPMALRALNIPTTSPQLWRSSTFGGVAEFDIVRKATLQRLVCLNLKAQCRNNVWVSFKTPRDARNIYIDK